MIHDNISTNCQTHVAWYRSSVLHDPHHLECQTWSSRQKPKMQSLPITTVPRQGAFPQGSENIANTTQNTTHMYPNWTINNVQQLNYKAYWNPYEPSTATCKHHRTKSMSGRSQKNQVISLIKSNEKKAVRTRTTTSKHSGQDKNEKRKTSASQHKSQQTCVQQQPAYHH